MTSHTLTFSPGRMYTPYKDLLYTNVVPLEDQCQAIRDFAIAPMTELGELNDEIVQLQAMLDQLIRNRDDLSEFIESHLALVSPARKLPHDILREIFTVCLPEDKYAIMNRAQSQLDWRSLALSMPQLWASLHIAAPPEIPWVHLKTINEGVKSWLAISGGLPLSISYVWISTASWNANDSESSLILKTIAEFSRRWGHMHFQLPSYSAFAPLGTLSPNDVPLLKSIVVDYAGDVIPAELDFFSFVQGPSTRGVSIRSRFQFSGLRALIPWSQLCHLSFPGDSSRIMVTEALDLFRQCPNLETCMLNLRDGRETIVPAQPIVLEHLWQLCINHHSWANLRSTQFFSHISLPNLRCLELDSGPRDSLMNLDLSNLDAPERLTSLSLSLGTSMSIDSLSQCLSLFPMLQSFVACQHREYLAHNGPITSAQLFSLLTPQPENPAASLCPPSPEHLLPRSRRRIRPRTTCLNPTTLRYPIERDMKFMSSPRSYFSPPNRRVQCDPAATWGPISSGWLAEYAEWGLPSKF
ncbi:hypothetical protein FB451DRAFT_1521054 [Mycena latifolia]|nr:hypothetical protein FB451DRAFT_1521054 [Mycena latifolia]